MKVTVTYVYQINEDLNRKEPNINKTILGSAHVENTYRSNAMSIVSY